MTLYGLTPCCINCWLLVFVFKDCFDGIFCSAAQALCTFCVKGTIKMVLLQYYLVFMRYDPLSYLVISKLCDVVSFVFLKKVKILLNPHYMIFVYNFKQLYAILKHDNIICNIIFHLFAFDRIPRQKVWKIVSEQQVGCKLRAIMSL